VVLQKNDVIEGIAKQRHSSDTAQHSKMGSSVSCITADLSEYDKGLKFSIIDGNPVQLIAILKNAEYVVDSRYSHIAHEIMAESFWNTFYDFTYNGAKYYYCTQRVIDNLHFKRYFSTFWRDDLCKMILTTDQTENLLCAIDDPEKCPELFLMIKHHDRVMRHVMKLILDKRAPLSQDNPIRIRLTPVVNELEDDEINEIFRKIVRPSSRVVSRAKTWDDGGVCTVCGAPRAAVSEIDAPQAANAARRARRQRRRQRSGVSQRRQRSR
jgi:hypothetical protein